MSEEPQHVALVLNGQTRLMEVGEAKDRYAALESKRLSSTLTEDDRSMQAALTLSLGTMFDLKRVRADWEATGNKWEGPV